MRWEDLWSLVKMIELRLDLVNWLYCGVYIFKFLCSIWYFIIMNIWALLDMYRILINNVQNCKALVRRSRLYSCLPSMIHTKRWFNGAAATRQH